MRNAASPIYNFIWFACRTSQFRKFNIGVISMSFPVYYFVANVVFLCGLIENKHFTFLFEQEFIFFFNTHILFPTNLKRPTQL